MFWNVDENLNVVRVVSFNCVLPYQPIECVSMPFYKDRD